MSIKNGVKVWFMMAEEYMLGHTIPENQTQIIIMSTEMEMKKCK